jgi:hypothetical protein
MLPLTDVSRSPELLAELSREFELLKASGGWSNFGCAVLNAYMH